MHKRSSIVSAVLAATQLLLAAPAPAAEGPLTTVSLREENRGEDEPLFMLPGHMRMRFIHLGDFALDELGTQHGQNDYATMRFRVGPRFNFGKGWRLVLEADFLDGIVVGDTTAVGDVYMKETGDDFQQAWMNDRSAGSLDGVDLRKAYLEWRGDVGLFRLGQMGSSWGMGLLANAGDEPGSDFADMRGGDLVERFLYATQPLRLFGDSPAARAFIVAVAFDLVYRDENASLLDGDLAWQGVFSVAYRPEGWDVGVYVAYRDQEDADGDFLRATAIDIAGGLKQKLGDFELRAQAEAIFLTGETNRARFDGVPETLDVESFGAAALVGFGYEEVGLDASFEAGYASGDNDRSDGTIRHFSFDSNHRVGMILFEDVVGRMSVRSLDRVADPGLSGQPPKGYEAIPTGGSVTNAWYINPVIRYRPVQILGLKAGLVWATTDADFADPYNTAANGGFNTSFRSLAGAGGDLGIELDGAVELEMAVSDLVAFRIGLQGGVLLPGEAFDDADGNSLPEIAKVRVLADLVW